MAHLALKFADPWSCGIYNPLQGRKHGLINIQCFFKDSFDDANETGVSEM